MNELAEYTRPIGESVISHADRIDALASPNASRAAVLRVLTSPDIMADLFCERWPELSAGQKRIRSCRPRVLKKRLGSRTVVSYRLKLQNGHRSKTKISRLVIKRYADGAEGKKVFRRMSQLWDAGFDYDSRLQIPKPIEYLEDYNILIQEHACGALLMKRLARGDRIGSSRMRRSACWLAKLHELDGVLDGLEPYEDTHVAIARFSEGLVAQCPEFEREIADVGSALSEKLDRQRSCPSVVVHGDFHPENIFVTRHGASVIDFDQIGLSDPARDPGYFIAQMRATALRVCGSLDASNAETKAFLEAYLANTPSPDALAVRIASFAALSFLESLFYIFCVLESRQPDVFSSYFKEIERLIDVQSAQDIVVQQAYG